ncbi:DMT family transporter [Sphingomonas panacisoli]|uniref:DMT family transporter n=1 Tax=Sphingomonas panacisoli TaxID=1813879 RepID=A0A5B8LKP5_9SPHN|nr:DMT family transporter [Sphingomonas panacisoli]QDZ08499.1 DMT family transporter [Sphingomonas panacisoli]
MHQDEAPRKASSAQSVTAHPLAFAALVIANVLLAFGPVFVRMTDVGPVAAGFWRIALAVPILLAVTVGSGWRARGLSRGVWIALAIGGLCFAADLASWHIGIKKTQLANATLFGNSATLFFPIYGFLVARAWPSKGQGFALLLALFGAGLLMGRSLQVRADQFYGDLLCLTAGILYTVYFAAMAKARDTMAPVPALTMSTLASMLPLLIFAWALGEKIMPTDWWPLIGLALASQVFGQGLMTFALGQLSPMVIGIGLLTQPVIAATVGWLWYNERLDGWDLLGAVAVAIALVLVRRERKDTAPLAPEGVAGA